MSNEDKDKIKESLRKRRESGGCSMWREYLKEHPEAANHNWEKEFLKSKWVNYIDNQKNNELRATHY